MNGLGCVDAHIRESRIVAFIYRNNASWTVELQPRDYTDKSFIIVEGIDHGQPLQTIEAFEYTGNEDKFVEFCKALHDMPVTLGEALIAGLKAKGHVF